MKQLVLVRLSSMMAETVVYTPKGIFVFLNQSAHTQDPLRSLDMQLCEPGCPEGCMYLKLFNLRGETFTLV